VAELFEFLLQFISPLDRCPRACTLLICLGTRLPTSRGSGNWRSYACSTSATTGFRGLGMVSTSLLN